MDYINLKIAKDFSNTPGPRYINEGEHSGEKFRKETLKPLMIKAINEGKILRVDLDGVAGYATSFLEESFGGLIREENMDFNSIMHSLKIISNNEPYWIDRVNKYLGDANEKRKKTKK